MKPITRAQSEILNAIKIGFNTANKIADQYGMKYATASTRIMRLRDMGLLRNSHAGSYAINDENYKIAEEFTDRPVITKVIEGVLNAIKAGDNTSSKIQASESMCHKITSNNLAALLRSGLIIKTDNPLGHNGVHGYVYKPTNIKYAIGNRSIYQHKRGHLKGMNDRAYFDIATALTPRGEKSYGTPIWAMT